MERLVMATRLNRLHKICPSLGADLRRTIVEQRVVGVKRLRELPKYKMQPPKGQ